MTESLNKLKELKDQAAELIAQGTPQSLEKARLLLNHQQLLIRQVLNEAAPLFTLEEQIQTEAAFMGANTKLQDQ